MRAARLVGWLGVAAVAVGYALEAIRQRGDCDAGDMSPDTVGLSVVLIVFVGGLAGIAGIVTAAVAARRHGSGPGATLRAALPAALSLAGSLAIFVVAGSGPATWFQYCAT